MREVPIYYRWIISPTTGDVSISHDAEGHPADILLHEGLALERPEQDLINGYAIRHPNGWKLMDENDKELEDPFLIRKINDALEEFS